MLPVSWAHSQNPGTGSRREPSPTEPPTEPARLSLAQQTGHQHRPWASLELGPHPACDGAWASRAALTQPSEKDVHWKFRNTTSRAFQWGPAEHHSFRCCSSSGLFRQQLLNQTLCFK